MPEGGLGVTMHPKGCNCSNSESTICSFCMHSWQKKKEVRQHSHTPFTCEVWGALATSTTLPQRVCQHHWRSCADFMEHGRTCQSTLFVAENSCSFSVVFFCFLLNLAIQIYCYVTEISIINHIFLVLWMHKIAITVQIGGAFSVGPVNWCEAEYAPVWSVW